MNFGACQVCPLKDEIIKDLRQQLADTTKSLLASTDARAYALRYQEERARRPDGDAPPTPPNSPARMRARQYVPPPEASPPSVEALFEEQAQLEKRLQQG